MKNKKVYKVVIGLLCTVFIAGISLILFQVIQYYKAYVAQDRADKIVQLAELRHQAILAQTVQNTPSSADASGTSISSPETAIDSALNKYKQATDTLAENAQFLLHLDYSPMQEENEDVMGWIYIPDSPVSYPILRSADNADYLKAAWDGSYNVAGSIFLECQNNDDFQDFNTILYGHHMKSGSHFAAIINYWNPDYRDKHPYIYIVSGGILRCYEVFTAHEAPIDSDTYRLYFPNEESKQIAIDAYMENSVLDQEIVPTTEDYILTLSTCLATGNYDTRWVIQARLMAIYELSMAPTDVH